jgi:hypothetical protein
MKAERNQMDVINNSIHKTLVYVQLLNAGGYYPSCEEVDLFATTPQPNDETRTNALYAAALGNFGALFSQTSISAAAPPADYLIKTQLLKEGSSGLSLSGLGTSLLKGINSTERLELIDGLEFITLEAGSTASTVELGRIVDNAGAGMLIDPYFDAQDLGWLVTSTEITRLLIGPTPANKKKADQAKKKDAQISAFLAELPVDRVLEIRRDESGTLHDRAVLHDSGKITMLGTSLPSVKKKLTTVVTLSAGIVKNYEVALEAKWREAEPISPSLPPSLEGKLLDTKPNLP